MTTERATLERIAGDVYTLSLRVSELNGTVSSLREITDTKLEAISEKIDNSLKIHMLLKEEHEKHLQALTDEESLNTNFRNNTIGAIKFTIWLIGATFAIAGIYIALAKTLISP